MESQSPIPPKLKLPRILLVDVARGVALLAMTIYHFAWDLEFFGWLARGTIGHSGWVFFARSIATSFLFLVGVSLSLAHAKRIGWRGFGNRLLQVCAAALVISLATYVMDPKTFIFFGILHAIALFSLLGLAFVRIHWVWSVLAACLVLFAWQVVAMPVFERPLLLWVGLHEFPPVSNDYVPLFPWFAATLLGIATAKAMPDELWHHLAELRLPGILERPLVLIGQHSLAYYLLHQPVMIVGLWLFTTFVAQPDPTSHFLNLCQRECLETSDRSFCVPYCACVADEMKREGIFYDLNKGAIRLEESKAAQTIVRQCSNANRP